MTDEYRIPTHQIPVELLLAGPSTIRGDLCLGEHSEREIGPERPLDLLNGDKRFFPVRKDGEGVVLVRRRAVLSASLSADDVVRIDPTARELLSEAPVEETDAREVGVELTLEDGTEVSGTVAYVLPRGERRLQDFLNSSETFFRVWDGATLHLVNGDRISRLRAEPGGRQDDE